MEKMAPSAATSKPRWSVLLSQLSHSMLPYGELLRPLDALTASNQLLSCLLSSPAALRLVIVINSTATAPHGNLPRRTRQYSRNDLSPGSFVKAFRHTHELRSDRLLLLRMFSFLLIAVTRKDGIFD